MSTPDLSKRRALGKGLDSLLPRNQPSSPPPAEDSSGRPRDLPIAQIDANPYQTRSSVNEGKLNELASSIAATGVVQPIIVRPTANGRYQLIAGERRWLASKSIGKETIPAIIRQASDEQSMEMTIVENLQRADLNPMEQARAYGRLGQEFKFTQEQMAVRTGKDRTSVSNFLRLLRLPPEVQAKVESGELSFGHARALLSLENPETILMAARKVGALSLSVRQTESYVQGLLHPERRGEEKEIKQPLDPNVREARDRLQRALGLKVRIEDKKGRGRVVIEYSNLEDFDTLIEMLDRN